MTINLGRVIIGGIAAGTQVVEIAVATLAGAWLYREADQLRDMP